MPKLSLKEKCGSKDTLYIGRIIHCYETNTIKMTMTGKINATLYHTEIQTGG